MQPRVGATKRGQPCYYLLRARPRAPACASRTSSCWQCALKSCSQRPLRAATSMIIRLAVASLMVASAAGAFFGDAAPRRAPGVSRAASPPTACAAARAALRGGVGGGGGGDPAARVTPAAARRAPRRADALHPRLRLLEPLPRDAALPQGGRRRRRGDDGGRHAGAARRLHGDADPLRPRLPPPAVQAGAAHRRLWLRRPADAAGARRAQFGPRNSSARNSPAQFSAIL